MMRNINDLFSSPNAHVIRGPITVSLSSRQNWFSEAIDSLKRVCYWAFHTIFVTWFLVVFGDQVTKILNNSLFTFFYWARQNRQKRNTWRWKSCNLFFGILVVLTKNELTKKCNEQICNEPGIWNKISNLTHGWNLTCRYCWDLLGHLGTLGSHETRASRRPVKAVRAMGTLRVGTSWWPTYAPIHPAVPVVYYYVKTF